MRDRQYRDKRTIVEREIEYEVLDTVTRSPLVAPSLLFWASVAFEQGPAWWPDVYAARSN